MSTQSNVRFTRQNGRDVCVAVGVVVITAWLLYALPEIESDLPPSLVLGLVSAGAILFLIKRVVAPMVAKSLKHRRHRRHSHRISR